MFLQSAEVYFSKPKLLADQIFSRLVFFFLRENIFKDFSARHGGIHVLLALKRLRQQESCEFEDSLGYIKRHHLKKEEEEEEDQEKGRERGGGGGIIT